MKIEKWKELIKATEDVKKEIETIDKIKRNITVLKEMITRGDAGRITIGSRGSADVTVLNPTFYHEKDALLSQDNFNNTVEGLLDYLEYQLELNQMSLEAKNIVITSTTGENAATATIVSTDVEKENEWATGVKST